MWSRLLALALLLLPAPALADVKEKVAALAPSGLVLVVDGKGNELVAQNADEPFVPASWFAKDFRDWDAVRGVLIGSVVGLAINIIINVVATMQGWLIVNAWGSTVVLVLLLLGGIYQLMVHGLGARTLR